MTSASLNRDLLGRLLGHDAWATRVLLERCRDLTPQQFTQTFDIGPGSLHDTLLHVVGALGRWADRIGERPLGDRIEDTKGPRTPDEIITLLEAGASAFRETAAGVLQEDRLDEMMEFVLPDQRFTFTRGTAIVHVITHGAHHRAQVLNMMRRLGLDDLPDLDAIEWELTATPGSPPGQ